MELDPKDLEDMGLDPNDYEKSEPNIWLSWVALGACVSVIVYAVFV